MSADRSVTFIASSLRLSGGVLVMVEYANGLAERGYRVALVTSAGGACPEVQEKLSPAVRVLSAATSVEQAARPAGKLQLAWEMARLVPACQTLIATHTPTVVPALIAQRLRRQAARVVWFHQDYAEMFEERPIERYLLRRAPCWVERVITVSQACRDEIRKVSGVTAIVVPQGYSIAGAACEPPPPRDPHTILYVGDRRPRKGWDDLLTAAALVHQSHPDLRLAIVTKEQGEVRTDVPYDLHLLPSWQQVQRLYCSCAVLVSASWWEGFGRPPLEAMANGTPVVTTDSRGVREYARDGENCLMTPIRDPAALAQAIRRVLDDGELARRLGEAGRRTAQDFTWERSVDLFVRALEDARPLA